MNSFRKKQLIGACMFAVIAAAVTTLTHSRPASAENPNAGSAPVTIVNPLPLPVTGSTTVSGTVAATQNGTWTVNVAGPQNPFTIPPDQVTTSAGGAPVPPAPS